MSFGENLQFLRKRNGITQEQLAERLSISRQSVSKWESDAGYPELNTILQLCEMFSCSMDVLLRGDVEKSIAEDEAGYDAHMNGRAFWNAIAVGLILIGIAVSAVWESLSTVSEIGEAAFLAFVAAAVVIFIIKGMQHNSFRKRYPKIGFMYPEEKLQHFEKIYPCFIAIPVGLIILGFTGMLLLEDLFERSGVPKNLADGIFFFLLAIAVAFIVFGVMLKDKYNIAGYNQETMRKAEKEKDRQQVGKWCGIIMLTATALFLISLAYSSMEFTAAWDAGLEYNGSIMAFSWVVFPVGGILCGIVSIALHKPKQEDNQIENKQTEEKEG